MTKNLVVGAGFSGTVIANLLAAELNEKVVVADRRENLAGNCYDFRDKNGIMIHKYGSHIFHTSNKKVWDFINRFCKFNNYEHKVEVNLDGKLTTIPFNLNSLYDIFSKEKAYKLEEKLLNLFEYGSKIPILEFQNQKDEDLKELSDFIYNKIFLHYTEKQWGRLPEEIDKSVTSRVPIYISRDNRYFQDEYQGIPTEGYTKLIERMLDHENIEIKRKKDNDDNHRDDDASCDVFVTHQPTPIQEKMLPTA